MIWMVKFVVGNFFGDLFIQWFVYIMQVLEFVLIWVVVLFCQLINCCQCMGVVCCELWVDQIWYCQQFFCIGEIRNVGIYFVGINWIIFKVVYLCMFNFIILVCVFYQVNYQMVMVVGGEINQVIDY